MKPSEYKFNPQKNLIEKMEENFPLQDVSEPNLFRGLFPYDEIPKIAFNYRTVPMEMPDNIWITDTTFRDGQQSREPYTTEQIKTIYKYLHRLSGPKGVIRQSEFFLYTKRDRDAVYECLGLGYQFPEITAWIRANRKDFEMVKEVGLPETGILMSCSDHHIFLKRKMTRARAVEEYLAIARECIEVGVRPRCHLEDITRADFYGFVVPLVRRLMQLSEESGVPIKIRACDTMGYGVTFPGTSLPRSVQGIIHGLVHHAGVPHGCLEWHGHNDFYRSVINASYAWLYGASGVNASLFGIGERTGNTPLEGMAIEYTQLRGTPNGMDLRMITEIADYFRKEIGYTIPPMTPFVGENFNVTRAGIHADGLLKDEEIYNAFDTKKILNRPPKIVVSDTSGLAGVAHWLNLYVGKTDAFSKNDPAVVQVKAWVDDQYANGRVTTITDDELAAVAQTLLKENAQ